MWQVWDTQFISQLAVESSSELSLISQKFWNAFLFWAPYHIMPTTASEYVKRERHKYLLVYLHYSDNNFQKAKYACIANMQIIQETMLGLVSGGCSMFHKGAD